METVEELATRISAIAAVARTGLAWSNELFERERYERILQLASEMADILTSYPEQAPDEAAVSLATELRQSWLAQVKPGASGYVTPKVSTGALCFNPEGRLLLGQRGDSGMWFIPTGWLEVGMTPAENIVKEVREETGIICRPLRLVAVRDTRFHQLSQSGPRFPNPGAIHNIALAFLCEALTGEFKLHPLETKAAGFFSEEEARQLVHERALPIIEQGFAAWRGELTGAYFDELEA